MPPLRRSPPIRLPPSCSAATVVRSACSQPLHRERSMARHPRHGFASMPGAIAILVGGPVSRAVTRGSSGCQGAHPLIEPLRDPGLDRKLGFDRRAEARRGSIPLAENSDAQLMPSLRPRSGRVCGESKARARRMRFSASPAVSGEFSCCVGRRGAGGDGRTAGRRIARPPRSSSA